MIPFRVEFRAGVSLYHQVIYAAKKALVSGHLRPGDAFPSVRSLSAALKINPNTAHKVVTHLLNEGLLDVLPGTGTVVARRPDSSRAERSKLLDNELERLAVEAIKLGLSIDEVSAALERHWERLKPSASLAGKGGGRK